MKIEKPGLYYDMSSQDYFADPCPLPSLTQSVAKILLDQSPLHAWHAHPRLNPDWRPDDDTKFDVGNVAHKLLIGRGKELEIFDAPDWNATGMGKGAKTELHANRDAARAAGKVAVLGKTVARADRMVKAAREQLDLRGLTNMFTQGNGEVVTAWQEPSGFWCRQMIDWLSPAKNVFTDFKTTDMSVAPHGLGRMMANAGWPIQAAMAERGLDAIDPDNAGRRRFFFVVQETHVPYALNVVEITEGPLTMGRKMLDMARHMWGYCLRHDRWPGYPAEIVVPQYPGWAETQFLEREIEAEERRAPEPMLTDLRGG
jgi:PDDEXK-like domain of unknown function (DUF3799)